MIYTVEVEVDVATPPQAFLLTRELAMELGAKVASSNPQIKLVKATLKDEGGEVQFTLDAQGKLKE